MRVLSLNSLKILDCSGAKHLVLTLRCRLCERVQRPRHSNKKRLSSLICIILLNSFVLSSSPLHAEAPPSPTHGISIFGDLKYPANFTYFDYVNPNAPKGGNVKGAAFGSFDSFNPFIIKGTPAIGIAGVHCTLLTMVDDEPFSLYGYLAEKVELAPDRKSVMFTLNKKAKFSDGTPVTADDVIFSFDTLIKKGTPLYAQYYKDVKNVEKTAPNQVRFVFSTDQNRELAAILGQLPVFSKAFYTKHNFESGNLTPPVGCGPYKVEKFQPGQEVTYTLVPGWWGENVPSQKGRNNFDLTFIYYRDQTVLFEAFKAGDHDFRGENIAKNWAQGYDIPPVEEGKLIRKVVPNHLPQGMQMFIFNTRKPLFQDRKVREALTKAFDFEWANKNLFFNTYTRSLSYFSNSDMASAGLPQDDELALLEPHKDQLPAELFKQEFKLPITNATGNDRRILMTADKLLKEAGWVIKDGRRVNKKTGELFTFEILLNDPAYERIALALQRNLKALGIDMTTRTVTLPQYIQKTASFDYDMILTNIPQSETPGNEQRDYWVSKYADLKDGRNYSGVKDPVVDELVTLLINSPDRQTLRTRVHALDRVLQWGYYGIPGWHSKESRIAYWNKFGMPDKKPKDGVGFDSWWVDSALEKKLQR
ncbi:MAG: ABC transporter substrate-binding protein [Proteobacteria bacterium]|nr:ABC transporter substrate-binding protein [Pseudomonadota bacterium]